MKKLTINSAANGRQDILIDDEDYGLVSQYNWFIYACSVKGKRARTMYAVAHIKGRTVRMHRLILKVIDRKVIVDHKDHNGLNNQKSNLRIATSQQNQFNMRPFNSNKTGFKGVSYNKKDKRYAVFLGVNNKHRFFGNFSTAVEAAKKYNELARQYHGEFAYQNPI
jgi:hypothetical protein